jgi:hypothetical protein
MRHARAVRWAATLNAGDRVKVRRMSRAIFSTVPVFQRAGALVAAVALACAVLIVAGAGGASAMSAPSPDAGTLANAPVITATASNTATVTYEEEGLAPLLIQLQSHTITSVEINKVAHHLHLTLINGEHRLVNYPGHEEPKFQALIHADGVPITIEYTGAAAGPVHHKLRYVAAAVLVVLLVALVVALIVRRRRLAGYAEHDEGPSRATPPAGSPE